MVQKWQLEPWYQISVHSVKIRPIRFLITAPISFGTLQIANSFAIYLGAGKVVLKAMILRVHFLYYFNNFTDYNKRMGKFFFFWSVSLEGLCYHIYFLNSLESWQKSLYLLLWKHFFWLFLESLMFGLFQLLKEYFIPLQMLYK